MWLIVALSCFAVAIVLYLTGGLTVAGSRAGDRPEDVAVLAEHESTDDDRRGGSWAHRDAAGAISADDRRSVDLVATVGQSDRLRVIHRRVRLSAVDSRHRRACAAQCLPLHPAGWIAAGVT